MSHPKPAETVKLIMSLFSRDADSINEALKALSSAFGEADFISPLLKFDYTNYYEKEMGLELVRRFVSFARLIPPEDLPDIKLMTNEMEGRFSEEGQRRLNVDPGYIAPSHLILATGKGFSHRPYLRSGIYADLTLMFQDSSFRGLPWTYPDYGSSEIIEMMNKIRKKYIEQLKVLRKRQS